MNINKLPLFFMLLLIPVALSSCQSIANDPKIGDYVIERGDISEEEIEKSKQYSMKAYNHYQNKEYKQAIELYDKAVVLNPNEYRNYTGLGMIFLAQKDFSQASNFFVEALYINPDDLVSLSGLASIYVEIDQFEKAIEYYNRIIKLDPGNPKNYLAIGDIYLHTGHPKEALKYYKKVLELDPENKSALEKVKKIESNR